MPKNWSAEEDCRLYAAWIASQPAMKTNFSEIAAFCGATPSSVDHRLRKLKREIATLKESPSGEVSASPKRKRDSDSNKSTPKKVSKKEIEAGTNKAHDSTKKAKGQSGSKKSKFKFDSEDEAEDSDDDNDEPEEKTPELGSDDEEVNDTLHLEPETPTKRMPGRQSKPKIGRFREESISEDDLVQFTEV